VAQQALHAMSVDAGTQQQRRGGVPQIVEAHLARNRFRPERATARLRELLAGSVGALETLRAVALLIVGVALLVTAPAADVLVAFD
jgi:hypothetical protein